MALYPEAKVDLITKGTPVALTRVDGYLAHTIVGSAASCISMFKNNGYGGSTAHFTMDYAGNVTQLVDTKHRANCQVEGNWRLLSCEHADYGEGFPTWNLNDAGQVPAFTAAQVEAEIELQLWMIRTHGFPARLMTSSKGEQGIGYHRLGCDPYRVSGGEKWSSSYGKVCFPIDTTDVLTARGWVRLSAVTGTDQVASWSLDSEQVTFAPAARIESFRAPVVDVGGFESTADHEWVVRDPSADVRCSCGYSGTPRGVRNHAGKGTWRGEDHQVLRTAGWKKVRAADLRTGDLLPSAVQADMPGLPLSADQVRLLVWAQGDGHYMRDRGSGNLYGVEWHLSKPRKIDRLSALLDRVGVAYTKHSRSDGTTTVRVYGDAAREQIIERLPEKRFTTALLSMSSEQASAFLSELIHVDGSADLNCYFTTDGDSADVVQAVATLNGQFTTHRVDAGGLHWVRFVKRPRRARSAVETRTTDVSCLTTIDGTLIVRQHGRVVVSGNCPGARRIEQLQTTIFPEVQRRLAGGTPTQEDDMPAYPAWSKADRDKMLADIRDYAVENAAGPVPGGDTNSFKDLIWRVARIEANVDKILASLSAAPDPQ